jgi:Tol biopolymer transport system component
MRADGSHRHRIPGTRYAQEPTFAPNGKRIAFVITAPFRDIVTLRTDGTARHRLTFSRSEDMSPSYAPTGRQIVFVSDRNGPWEVFTMNANGSDQRLLRPCGPFASPSYSPSGKRIAFAKSPDIFTMSANGGNVRRITHTPNPSPARYRAFAEFPDWGG